MSPADCYTKVMTSSVTDGTTGNWNFADLWEMVADDLPDAPATIHGDVHRTWAEFDRRADGIAKTLLDAGLERQQAVAQYLYNCPEYMESMFAAFKAALVPVNTNYRYTADELLYLWDNADAGAVVFHGTFVDTIESIREQLTKVRVWLWVDDATNGCPDWATPYEAAAVSATERVHPDWGRTGDDLNMLYTGGTTGMPKGVMWRQDDLAVVLTATLGNPLPDAGTVDDRRGVLTAPGRRFIPACPQMHGTGNFPGLAALTDGGCIVTLTGRNFEAAELLDTIERERVNVISMVGDAFGKPILRALDAEPGRWDLSSLVGITSSGVMWSKEVKDGLLGHHPNMLLLDAFSSSEALGMGSSISGAGATIETAKFELSPNSIVIDEENRPIPAGSGEIGRLAVGGRQPVGYYKDPVKTAATFLEIDGGRYSCPGDFATVEADGSITLLGRGSVCINTGGEKVFPEEVEEALKRHPGVLDAVVVGVPDEKFGEAVTGVVEVRPGQTVEESEVIAHVRRTLAAYKSPKRVLVVDTIGRAPNGKVDYKRLKAEAIDTLGLA
ncbi:MAG: acyl-CoA synthetase [Ilumatobacteraceae bacterium]